MSLSTDPNSSSAAVVVIFVVIVVAVVVVFLAVLPLSLTPTPTQTLTPILEGLRGFRFETKLRLQVTTFRILKEVAIVTQVRGQKPGVFEMVSRYSQHPRERPLYALTQIGDLLIFHLFVPKKTAKTILGSETKPKYESSKS